MDSAAQPDVTHLLHAMSKGEQAAVDRLLPLVYDELHALAHRQRYRWRFNETVNTTALVHEAYLQMIDQAKVDWQDRAHFFRVAAQAMRYILMHYVRDQKRQKRGGDWDRVSMSHALLVSDAEADQLLALDDALKRLADVNERQSQIVECRFFAGMTVEETAAALGVSTPTVKRGWKMARLWLYREMTQDLG